MVESREAAVCSPRFPRKVDLMMFSLDSPYLLPKSVAVISPDLSFRETVT
jgi:hypothetical protein